MMTVEAIQTAAAEDPAARHRKLVDAAQQFEAMFLQQLLKSTGVDGEAASDDSPSSGSDTYKSFGTEAVAKAISQAGGLGIARQVVRQVERVSSPQKKDETKLK